MNDYTLLESSGGEEPLTPSNKSKKKHKNPFHMPFWDAFHDSHPCMVAKEGEQFDSSGRDVHVRVTHKFKASRSGSEASLASGSEDDTSSSHYGHGHAHHDCDPDDEFHDDHLRNEYATGEVKRFSDKRVRNFELRAPIHPHTRQDTDPDAFDWTPTFHAAPEIMRKYIQVNCLNKGDFAHTEGVLERKECDRRATHLNFVTRQEVVADC